MRPVPSQRQLPACTRAALRIIEVQRGCSAKENMQIAFHKVRPEDPEALPLIEMLVAAQPVVVDPSGQVKRATKATKSGGKL